MKKLMQRIKRFFRENFTLTEITYSRAGDMYYVSLRGEERSRIWLSVDGIEGPLTEKQKREAGFLAPNWVEYDEPSGKRMHRKILPFVCWDCGVSRHEEVAWDDPRVKIYREMNDLYS